MNGRSYYNENDPFAAQWLRNLIAGGHIAPGDVDERSIVDVRASDLAGYTQCHFFAGIGGWSYALRLAGWDDTRPVWSGSCPCQPFSSAGRGKAADDERHLWPQWSSLIAECRPPVVFGEQVEAAIGWGWLDVVFADLEAEGYACGASVLPACSVSAPHIRQRLWWVGHSDSAGRAPCDGIGFRTRRTTSSSRARSKQSAHSGSYGGLADADSERVRGERRSDGSEAGEIPREVRQQWLRANDGTDGTTSGLADAVRGGTGHGPAEGLGAQAAADGEDRRLSGQRLRAGEQGATNGGLADAGGRGCREQSPEPTTEGSWQSRYADLCSGNGGLADANGGHASAEGLQRSGQHGQQPQDGGAGELGHPHNARPQGRLVGRDGAGQRPAGTAGVGFWDDLVWLPCRDGRARPTQPGLQPLAYGAKSRVGRLRAYGNAIVAPLAAEFIGAFLDSE